MRGNILQGGLNLAFRSGNPLARNMMLSTLPRPQIFTATEGFEVHNNNVIRDSSQGDFANRIPLVYPKVLNVFSIHDQLRQAYKKSGSPLQFDAVEVLGAQVQVDENFLGLDYTKTHKTVREAAPNSPVRGLNRGPNGPLLKPNPTDVTDHFIAQFALDTANPEGGTRLKTFESQGTLEEYAASMKKVKELQANGHNMIFEFAIPHSSGAAWKGLKENPYPEAMYLDKIKAAIALSKEEGFDPNNVVFGFKNMIGDVTAESTYSLTKKTMQYQIEQGLTPRLAWHIHGDDAITMDALVGAAKAAKEMGGKIHLDTTPGHNTGFPNQLDFVKRLIDENLLGKEVLTPESEQLMRQQDELYNATMHDYRAAKAPEIFTQADYVKYEIARGAGLSFMNGVSASGLPAKLGLTLKDSCHVVASALQTFAEVAGHPFAVTPGMQNKQIAALHIVNMMEKEGLLQGGNREELQSRIRQPLTDDAIKKLFTGLDTVVAEFLQGEMPQPMRPVLREMFPRRKGLLSDGVESQLPKAKADIEALQKEGKLPGGEEVFHSHVARRLVVGNMFPQLIRNPAMAERVREASPLGHNTREEWEAAKKLKREAPIVKEDAKAAPATYKNLEEIREGLHDWVEECRAFSSHAQAVLDSKASAVKRAV